MRRASARKRLNRHLIEICHRDGHTRNMQTEDRIKAVELSMRVIYPWFDRILKVEEQADG